MRTEIRLTDTSFFKKKLQNSPKTQNNVPIHFGENSDSSGTHRTLADECIPISAQMAREKNRLPNILDLWSAIFTHTAAKAQTMHATKWHRPTSEAKLYLQKKFNLKTIDEMETLGKMIQEKLVKSKFDEELSSKAYVETIELFNDQIIPWSKKNEGKMPASDLSVEINKRFFEHAYKATFFANGISVNAGAFIQEFAGKQFQTDNSGSVSQSQLPVVYKPPGLPKLDRYEALKKYTTYLSQEAVDGLLRPVLFRKNDIQRAKHILDSPHERNSLMLVAESGAGKTYLINGLAMEYAKEGIPMVKIDLTALVSGTTYRGQYEDRVKALISDMRKFAKENPNIRLKVAIDEVHNILGAGSTQGSNDFAEMFKSSGIFDDKNISFIAATTPANMRQTGLREDDTLGRRFVPFVLQKFSDETNLSILAERAREFEKECKVVYPLNLLESVYEKAKFEFTDKAMGRAEEILGQAAVSVRSEPLEISELEDKRDSKASWLKTIEDQRLRGTQLQGRYKRQAIEYPEEITKLDARIQMLKSRHSAGNGRPEVTASHVEDAFATLKGKARRMTDSEYIHEVLNIDKTLKTGIVGQESAIDQVSVGLRTLIDRMISHNPKDKRPIGTMIFLGSTGVGKTETAKMIAEKLFDGKFIREDMSDYMQSFSSSKMTGSPPGYVGFNQTQSLPEKVRNQPHSVLLLDEIEKAHPDMFNLLLQMFEEGEMKDEFGKPVSFRNTLIIMTSNLKHDELLEMAREHIKRAEESDDVDKEDKVKRARAFEAHLRQMITTSGMGPGFRPEQVGRIDEVVLFNPLTVEHIAEIFDKQIDSYNKNTNTLRDNNLRITLSDNALDRLIDLASQSATVEGKRAGEKGIGFVTPSQRESSKILKYGARDVRSLFEKNIKRYIFDELIDKHLSYDDKHVGVNLSNAELMLDYDKDTHGFNVVVKPDPPEQEVENAQPVNGAKPEPGDERNDGIQPTFSGYAKPMPKPKTLAFA